MKKQIKFLLVAALIVPMAALMLMGCGGKGNNTPTVTEGTYKLVLVNGMPIVDEEDLTELFRSYVNDRILADINYEFEDEQEYIEAVIGDFEYYYGSIVEYLSYVLAYGVAEGIMEYLPETQYGDVIDINDVMLRISWGVEDEDLLDIEQLTDLTYLAEGLANYLAGYYDLDSVATGALEGTLYNVLGVIELETAKAHYDGIIVALNEAYGLGELDLETFSDIIFNLNIGIIGDNIAAYYEIMGVSFDLEIVVMGNTITVSSDEEYVFSYDGIDPVIYDGNLGLYPFVIFYDVNAATITMPLFAHINVAMTFALVA